MANASFAVTGFLGGEISQFAQGRFDKPDYKVSLNVNYNAIVTEIGTWTRRPGSRHALPTRGGAAGRVIKFDFETSNPYTMEFTDGYLRFRSGVTLVTNNDAVSVAGVSTANPAVLNTSSATTWVTGQTLLFSDPGPCPLLENRLVVITKVDTTHFSLADALTGAAINGSTLGTISTAATVSSVQELTTSYIGGTWSQIIAVQAETTSVLLSSAVAPQALTVNALPNGNNFATFSLAGVTFLDGPYLDPPTTGVNVTPSAVKGSVTLTLGYTVYDSSQVYSLGDFVVASNVVYQSLQNNNSGNTPSSSAAWWEAVAANVGVNNGQGFQPTDIGRLVRLYNASAPGSWSSSSTYNAGDLVLYSGVVYQSNVGGNNDNTPSATSAYWTIFVNGWTWGQITALASTGAISGSTGTTDNTGFTNASSAFDGNTSQPSAQCAAAAVLSGFHSAVIGKDYGGSPQSISSVIVSPASDVGFWLDNTTSTGNDFSGVSISLYASNSAFGTGGTLLGQVTNVPFQKFTPYTINSSSGSTTYRYVWVQFSGTCNTDGGDFYTAEVQFYSNSGAAGAGAVVSLLGPELPNTSVITTFQLGVFSGTTGWPTCGCYAEGRIWLAGAVANRFDTSVSNGIVGSTINMAPTDSSGKVLDSSGISYTLNSDSVNPIVSMTPDLQGVICVTLAGEYLLQAPTTGPMTPTNIAGRRVTKIGGSTVVPQRTDHTIVFPQRYGVKLIEFFADAYSGKLSGQNLADKAQHITRAGIAELAYTQSTTPLIWGRDAAGALFSITYKREALTTTQPPDYYAWARHGLGSGRTVTSLCAGPSIGGNLDALTMVTYDSTTGYYHVEVLTDEMDELTPFYDASYLDDAIVPSSTVITNTGVTLNGLWSLNGKTVQVWASNGVLGLDLGNPGDNKTTFSDFVVSNGSITIPYGDGVIAGAGNGLFTETFAQSASYLVGFTFTSQGQLVRPQGMAETGARNGPGFGKKRREHRYSAHLVNSYGLSFGTTFSGLYPTLFNFPPAYGTGFTGIHEDTLNSDETYDEMMCWQVSRPYPANIVVVSANIETVDQ